MSEVCKLIFPNIQITQRMFLKLCISIIKPQRKDFRRLVRNKNSRLVEKNVDGVAKKKSNTYNTSATIEKYYVQFDNVIHNYTISYIYKICRSFSRNNFYFILYRTYLYIREHPYIHIHL